MEWTIFVGHKGRKTDFNVILHSFRFVHVLRY